MRVLNARALPSDSQRLSSACHFACIREDGHSGGLSRRPRPRRPPEVAATFPSGVTRARVGAVLMSGSGGSAADGVLWGGSGGWGAASGSGGSDAGAGAGGGAAAATLHESRAEELGRLVAIAGAEALHVRRRSVADGARGGASDGSKLGGAAAAADVGGEL